MKFARLLKNADGGFSWFGPCRWTGGHDGELVRIYPDGRLWRIHWCDIISSGSPPPGFESAGEACLAAEKSWPRVNCEGIWIESKTGGYFRKEGKKLIFYLRQLGQHWYAVRNDGMVLGKAGNPSWFATAEDASRAVEQEFHAPKDADPFRDTSDRWCWIKPKGAKSAA